jgi:hypothetical protein
MSYCVIKLITGSTLPYLYKTGYDRFLQLIIHYPIRRSIIWAVEIMLHTPADKLFTPRLSFFSLLGWSETESTITAAITGLLYQPRKMMDDECGAIGAVLGRGNRSTRRKPTPVPLCPPQIPDYLTRSRT